MSPQREPVQTQRAVRVKCIPDGNVIELPAGTKAQITQALGGSFTLVAEGQLVLLPGADADAIGKPVPATQAFAADIGPDELTDAIWQTLRTCYDPEVPIDIVELGLIYGVDLLPMDDGQFKVTVRMTLTAPGCGMSDVITDDVCNKVLALPRVGETTVQLVFDPPWLRTMMSDAAALALGL